MIFQALKFSLKGYKNLKKQGLAVKTKMCWVRGFNTLVFSQVNLVFSRFFKFFATKIDVLSCGGWLATGWQVDWLVG